MERTAARPLFALAATGRAGVAERVDSAWARAIAALVLVIWLIPTQRYTLPVQLPFNLEPYRLLILGLVAALLTAVAIGAGRLSAAGHGKPLLLLAGAALGAQVSNWTLIGNAGLQTQALKSLSFFLSFLVAFVLVCSTLRSRSEIDTVVKAIVAGAFVVAVAALYESRSGTNVFNNLGNWVPFLDEQRAATEAVRRGRLRVKASAQHPIALAAALTMCTPLAIYLFRRGATKLRAWPWLGVAVVLGAGALATVSRTVVLMFAAMAILALWLRFRQLLRWWPLLLALVAFTHVASPGSMGFLYRAMTPQQGLIAQQEVRAGQAGSGRVADFRPGLDRWLSKPLVGYGLGLGGTTGERAILPGESGRRRAVIYDDQWLQVLVSLGIVGFVGAVWFVWGAVVKLAQAARRTAGQISNLLTATAIACTGYAAGMLTYDAFSFVQVTLLFFVIAALGLRARTLVRP